MLETANAGKTLILFVRDDTMVTVNSHTVYVVQLFHRDLKVNFHVRIDWCGAHFGCPHGSRFYTSGIGELCLRYFRSNPVKGDDGVWQARHSVDLSLGVIAELKSKLLETLACGIGYIPKDEHTL